MASLRGRRGILAASTLLLLFLGLIYAYSVVLAPMKELWGWSVSQMTLVFALSIGMFARATDLRNKTAEELAELRARGITGLTIGTETGDDAALAFMNKGTTAAETLHACRRLDEAGIAYHLTYMTGLSGAGNGVRAARATAALFNELRPRTIGIVSLTLFPEAPLAADVAAGTFVEASERERLEELRAFIAALRIPTVLQGDTVSNTVPLFGRLPEDRARLLAELDRACATQSEDTLATYRRQIRHL